MYQGSDLEGIPESHGVYSLVRKIKNQRSTPWVYTGLSNDLLMRVKTHLTQQTGTYSGNKNAASIMLDRLTNVRWWDISHIEWPEDVTTEYIDSKKQVKVAKKGTKAWKQFLAGGAEIIIKKRFPPMLDDQAKPKKLALLISQSPIFQEEIQKIIDNWEEISLPSLENLNLEINDLKLRVLALETLVSKLDLNGIK
jgi:hypothetical protein